MYALLPMSIFFLLLACNWLYKSQIHHILFSFIYFVQIGQWFSLFCNWSSFDPHMSIFVIQFRNTFFLLSWTRWMWSYRAIESGVVMNKKTNRFIFRKDCSLRNWLTHWWSVPFYMLKYDKKYLWIQIWISICQTKYW